MSGLKEQRDGLWQDCGNCGRYRATWLGVYGSQRLCHTCLVLTEQAEWVFTA